MDPLTIGLIQAGASAVVGGGLDFFNTQSSSKKQFQLNKALMDHQNELNVYNYQHQHQWRVEDMRQAGLNPILSQTSGSAVPGVGLNSASLNKPQASIDTSFFKELAMSRERQENKLASANLDKILDERHLLLANSASQYSQERLNDQLAYKAITDNYASASENDRRNTRLDFEIKLLNQQQREQNERQSTAEQIKKQEEITTWYMQKQLPRLGSKAHNYFNWARDFFSAGQPVLDVTKNAQKQAFLKKF